MGILLKILQRQTVFEFARNKQNMKKRILIPKTAAKTGKVNVIYKLRRGDVDT